MIKNKHIFLIIIILLLVTGCGEVDYDTGEKLNRILIRNKIINKEYEYYDITSHHHQIFSGGWGTSDNYFIYKNKNDDIIVIKYTRSYDDKKINKYYKNEYYVASIYHNVTEEKVTEYDCDSSTMEHKDNYYKNSDHKCTIDPKYPTTEDNKEEYIIYQKSFLIFRYYKVEKTSTNIS